MIGAIGIACFFAGVIVGAWRGYHKGIARGREIRITSAPAAPWKPSKPWTSIDAEHADLTRG